MAFCVVWKIGTPSLRRVGVHAFAAPGLPGAVALCSSKLVADGYPLGDPAKAPKCKGCVERLALVESHGGVLRKNYAGLIRSERLKEVAKSHWQLHRHGGRQKNSWRLVKHGDVGLMTGIYWSLVNFLKKKNRGRGGFRLLSPDGQIEREFIKSPWLKEKSDAPRAAADPEV